MKTKRLAGVLACLILVLLCTAGINSMYVQKHGDNGWLFHIFSQKMPSKDKKAKALEYDYTYLEQIDSVTLLSTIITKNAYRPITTTISYCDTQYSVKTRLVFLRPKGKNYEIRTSSMIPFDVWEAMYQSPRPFTLTYVMEYGNTPANITFGYNTDKWRDNSRKLRQIISTIRINIGK